MRLRYDDDFVESAVLNAVSGKSANIVPAQVRRFHAERERCYDFADPDERNAAFFRLHLGWFREWGMEKMLLGLLAEYPLISPSVNTLAFRKVRSKKDEAAELYVSNENGRSAVVAMRPERFEDGEAVARLLRHEFTHLSDMVDPLFGYSPQVNLRDLSPTQQRITRERYRVLWDITIDGRLARSGRCPSGVRERHAALFEHAYSFWPGDRRANVFEALWNEVSPRHEALLAFAADPRDLSRAVAPLPGSACPLCHFPTFEWAAVPALDSGAMGKLRAEFPQWMPEQGACKRCVEIYELAGKFELPPTVVL